MPKMLSAVALCTFPLLAAGSPEVSDTQMFTVSTLLSLNGTETEKSMMVDSGSSPWPSDPTCINGWIQGDGYGGSETYLGIAADCDACIQMVLSSDPSAAAATFRTPGLTSRVGQCYIEHGYAGSSGGATWITIPLAGWTPPATPTPAGGAGSGASAVGDPHLQNVHGERFDLMKEGKHILINIPRGKDAEHALLRVQADAWRLGGNCADIYFQAVNVTGSWAEAKQAGGYHHSVSQTDAETPEWVAFGKVELKVVRGRTDTGLRYLNVYVKHLGRAGYAVGGLLGEDDHEDVIVPSEACVTHMALVGTGAAGLTASSVVSVAVASLA